MDLDQRRCSLTMSNARGEKHRCFLIWMEAEKSWVHMKSTRSNSVINTLTWLVLLRLVYRHALSYSTLLYQTLQTLHLFSFFTNYKDMWQLCIKQVYWCHFPSSIHSLCASVSQFLSKFQTLHQQKTL